MRQKKKRTPTTKGSTLYLQTHDAINKHRFCVSVPEGYTPTKLHHYFVENEVEPMYQPAPMNRARSVLTPIQLVYAIYDGHNIGFKKNEDLLLFIDMLRIYVNKLGPFRGHDEELAHHVEMMEYVINTLRPHVANIKYNTMQSGRIIDTYTNSLAGILSVMATGE